MSNNDTHPAWQAAHTFSHEAMHTSFEIWIHGKEKTYAAQAADAAFDQLNDLDKRYLSRYHENSDISRLNATPVGQALLLGLPTLACLQQARQLYDWTGGAFDVTVGRWTSGQPVAEKRAAPEGFGLDIDSEALTATRRHAQVAVDLGGIGKGFALDVLIEQLKEWQVDQALVHGGGSTVRAVAAPGDSAGWPVTLSDPYAHDTVWKRFPLLQKAMAGSAQIARSHIVDPATGRPITTQRAAWSLAPNGALADGLSTAFMIMEAKEIQQLCIDRPDISGAVFDASEGKAEAPTFYGAWPQ